MEFRNSIPIYLQVMEDMKREMVTGGLPAGSRVESIRVLAARYGINLNTMQRVCAELERQGLLETKRGVSWSGRACWRRSGGWAPSSPGTGSGSPPSGRRWPRPW